MSERCARWHLDQAPAVPRQAGLDAAQLHAV